MFGDLECLVNASRGLSAIAEVFVSNNNRNFSDILISVLVVVVAIIIIIEFL